MPMRPTNRSKLYSLSQLFEGNNDANSIIATHIGPPIIALAFRIVPVVKYVQSVCLRLEVYGCEWEGKSIPDTCLLKIQ